MEAMAWIQIVNVLLLIVGIAGAVLIIMVLWKLNQALTIWLEQNRRK